MMRVLWIGVGGFVGSIARYGVSVLAMRNLGSAFPYGTLIVNVAGSFLMGLLMWFGLKTSLLGANTRLALTTGVLGGFTTFSAFSYETLALFQERAWALAAINVIGTMMACLAAVAIGWALAGFAMSR